MVILPNRENSALTVLQGQPINFTTAGLDRNGQPIGGLPIAWSVTDTVRNLSARPLAGGSFEARTPGTFTVVAASAGKQSQVTINVKPNPGYAIKRAFDKPEDNRMGGEKKMRQTLAAKNAIKTRQISSKKPGNAEEERRLSEEEKQIIQKIRTLPAEVVPDSSLTDAPLYTQMNET